MRIDLKVLKGFKVLLYFQIIHVIKHIIYTKLMHNLIVYDIYAEIRYDTAMSFTLAFILLVTVRFILIYFILIAFPSYLTFVTKVFA